MCIVIDINTLAMVFSTDNSRHSDFCLIKNWIEERNGYVVYGGTKYKAELAQTGRYMRLLRLMRDAGQAITICDAAVDKIEQMVREKTDGTGCDDQHIIALLGAARCGLLCSTDARSFEFVKNRSLYPKGAPVVKIYTSAKNKRLLKKSDPHTLRNVE
jgi:hypothetical protein